MTSALPRPAVEPASVPEPDLPLLHDRTYSVRSYKMPNRQMLLRGQVQDQKPNGMYISEDPDPLAVHHMVVDLVVQFPTMEIVDAKVIMETHPHTTCPSITADYQQLVGLSIARGFNRKVRELFGGSRGCTHTTALLQAMAPVVIQSVWSMGVSEGTSVPTPLPSNPTDEQLREQFAFQLNTCHVWAEDGPAIESFKTGGDIGPPLWIVDRMEQLGLDPSEWQGPFFRRED